MEKFHSREDENYGFLAHSWRLGETKMNYLILGRGIIKLRDSRCTHGLCNLVKVKWVCLVEKEGVFLYCKSLFLNYFWEFRILFRIVDWINIFFSLAATQTFCQCLSSFCFKKKGNKKSIQPTRLWKLLTHQFLSFVTL